MRSFFFILITTALLLLNLYSIPVSKGQTFPCDGSLYLSQNNRSVPTTINKIELGNNTVRFEPIANYNSLFNGIGFNRQDHFIYGFEGGSKNILRLKSDGSYEVVGTAENFMTNSSAAGAFTPEGIYIVHDRTTEKLHFFQINPSFREIDQQQLTWAPSSGNTGICDINFDDFVIDLNDPNRLISYQHNYPTGSEPASSRGQLLSIDINSRSATFGQVFTEGLISDNIILQIGAMFYANDGLLYGYGSQTSNFRQRHLISIHVENPQNSSYVSSGPLSQNTDGCSCPVNLKFTKEVIEKNEFCDSTDVLFRFTLVNNSLESFNGLNLSDTLSEGYFKELPQGGVEFGGATATLSTDKKVMSINDFEINAEDSIAFEVWARYPNLNRTLDNQAFINGFNSFVGDEIPSDDPATPEYRDPSRFNLGAPGSVTHQVDTTLCFGQSLTLNDSTYSVSGAYQQTFPDASAEGCDSIINIQLNILPQQGSNLRKEICYGDTLILHGRSYAEEGTYADTLVSSEGCDSILTLDLDIRPKLQASAHPTYIVDNCQILTPEIETGFTVDSIYWTPPNGLSCDDCLQPEISIDNDRSYVVTLYDEFGCSISLPISISTQGDASKQDVYIPNVFTPTRRDDLNDHFTVFSSHCLTLIEEMRVFDRWGNIVYEARDIPPNLPELGWDGRYKGRNAQSGVYTYQIHVRFFDGTKGKFYGTVTLL